MLKGDLIYLRALELSDIELLYKWENDTDNWIISHTQTPYSKFVLEQYIASAHEDIYTAKQFRLIVCDINNKPVGCIDLFDFAPNHLRVGVGILISEKDDRRNGYASEALKLLMHYCFETLNVKQIYCNITTDNEPSILFFQKHGFMITGIKKQWIRDGAKFKDELLLQFIKP